MSDPVSFEGVWYRCRPQQWMKRGGMFTFEDRGTLSVLEGGGVEFAGRKETLRIPVTRAVRYGRMGMDLFNNWVIVEFERGGDISEAHFSDGRWLGWRGIFGGTKRLYRALTEGSSD